MSEIRDRISSVATLRTLRPLWAGRTEAVFERLRTNSFGKTRLLATLTHIRDTASLLGPAGRGAARLVMERALATPRRVYIGAGVAALVVGIGANALLMQHGRHPAALLAQAAHDPSPASASAAPPAGAVEPAAAPGTAPAAQPPAAGASPANQASAPDTTASIAPQAQDKQHQSSAQSAPDSGRRVAALAPDQIGALLRGKSVDDGSHLVRAAQIALIKLGYAVKPNGAEDGATRRALRRFERAHGLSPTTEINAELVKQLTAAAKPGG
jgi:Putative peptidoglycan binding domain